MRNWMPNAQMTRAKVRQMREAGMEPEMIGFRIGWDWGHARVLDKHSQMMLEQAMLHEEEKLNLAAAWRATNAQYSAMLKRSEQKTVIFMVATFVIGFFFGVVV